LEADRCDKEDSRLQCYWADMHEPLRTDEFICNLLEFYDFHMNHKITVTLMLNEKGKNCLFNDAVGC